MPRITPQVLLRAYAIGIFPMAPHAASRDIFWMNPDRRGVIPIGQMILSKRLTRTFRSRAFEIRIDHAFHEVVACCADREDTWINSEISALYAALHDMGHAHSVEIWQDGQLAGGLYGVSLQGAFFGESMFHHRRDASKLAMIALMARLVRGGFRVLDTQFVTTHLRSLGAEEISRKSYQDILNGALKAEADFFALPPDTCRQEMLQLSTQTS